MAVFSTNQVRQLYVVNSTTDFVNPGGIQLLSKGNDIFAKYTGAMGDVMRTDLINKNQILYTSLATAEQLAYKLKGYKVTLNPDVNGGAPLEGRDYMLRVLFSEYIGISPVDKTLKYGTVHITPGMTASDFYAEMAYALMLSQKKEPNPIMGIAAIVSGTFEGNEIDETMTLENVKGLGTIEGIVIYEVGQPWHLGVMPQGVVKIDPQVTRITYNGDDTIFWGKVEKIDQDDMPDSYILPEGEKIADLEYFCMGERGDQYRYAGWPNMIPTKYLVDPDVEYDLYTIHYAYVGEGTHQEKSEKDIQFAVEKSQSTTFKTKLNAILPTEFRIA